MKAHRRKNREKAAEGEEEERKRQKEKCKMTPDRQNFFYAQHHVSSM
jgi:hypothetical protein